MFHLTLSMHLVVLVFIFRNMVIRAGVFSLNSRGYTERKIIQTLEHQDYKEASGPYFDVAIGILDKVENMRLHSFLESLISYLKISRNYLNFYNDSG